MTELDMHTAIETLRQPTTLTIHALSEPILSSTPLNNNHNRTSDISDTTASYSPAALSADLSHYKDLFRKLRFSYTEQVTKERFLKSLVSDSASEFLSPNTDAENTSLEQKLVEDKTALKQKKQDVATLLQEMETQAREVARKDAILQAQIAEIMELPDLIRALEERKEDLEARRPVRSENQDMNLGLEATAELLVARQRELGGVETEMEELREAVPRRKREVEGMRGELEVLEKRKGEAIDGAVEAKRRRKGGDALGDDLEKKGRWLKANESVLRSLLEV